MMGKRDMQNIPVKTLPELEKEVNEGKYKKNLPGLQKISFYYFKIYNYLLK